MLTLSQWAVPPRKFRDQNWILLDFGASRDTFICIYVDAPMGIKCNKKSYKAIMSLESVGFEPLTPFRPIFP